jgi:hypothetical protein
VSALEVIAWVDASTTTAMAKLFSLGCTTPTNFLATPCYVSGLTVSPYAESLHIGNPMVAADAINK